MHKGPIIIIVSAIILAFAAYVCFSTSYTMYVNGEKGTFYDGRSEVSTPLFIVGYALLVFGAALYGKEVGRGNKNKEA